MKEMSDKHLDNSFGVAGVVLGILSLVMFWMPFVALIFAIIGFIFSWKQKKKMSNSWVTAGLWLNGIGIVVGIIYDIKVILAVKEGILRYKEMLASQGTVGV